MKWNGYWKRLCSFLLAAVMVLSLVPMHAHAVEEEVTRTLYADLTGYEGYGDPFMLFYDENEAELWSNFSTEGNFKIYVMPATAKYYEVVNRHTGGGGGDDGGAEKDYPELPANADTFIYPGDWSCQHRAGFVNNACTTCGAEKVAMVDGGTYYDFASALEDWADGGTLTLLKDVTYDETIVLDGDAEVAWDLHLNGKTLDGVDTCAIQMKTGDLMIYDGTVLGKISASAEAGTLTLTDVFVESEKSTALLVSLCDSVSITGGSLNGTTALRTECGVDVFGNTEFYATKNYDIQMASSNSSVTFHTAPTQTLSLDVTTSLYNKPVILAGNGVTLKADMFVSADTGYITAVDENGAIMVTKCDHAGTKGYAYEDENVHEITCTLCHTENLSSNETAPHSIENGVCTACGGRQIFVDASFFSSVGNATMRYLIGGVEEYTSPQLDSSGYYTTILPGNAESVYWKHGEYTNYQTVTTPIPADKNCMRITEYDFDAGLYKVVWHNHPHEHTYSSKTGYCTECLRACEHSWGDDSVCGNCGYACAHSSSRNHKCNTCGFQMAHTFGSNGKCTGNNCSVTCKHPSLDARDVCSDCGMRKIYLVGTNVDELGIQGTSSYYYYTMTEDPDGVYSGFMPVGVEGMCFTSYDWDWEYTDGCSESFTYDGTHNAFRVIGKNAEGKVALHQFDYPCAHTYTGGTGVCDLCLEPCAHGSWDANYSCTTCGYACEHTRGYSDGKCRSCGKTCEHSQFAQGTCTACRFVCSEHQLDEQRFCTICDVRQIYLVAMYWVDACYASCSVSNQSKYVALEPVEGAYGVYHGLISDRATNLKFKCDAYGAELATDMLTLPEDKSLNCFYVGESYDSAGNSIFYSGVWGTYPCTHTYTGGSDICDICRERCAHGSWDANYSCTACGYVCEHDNRYDAATGKCRQCQKNLAVASTTIGETILYHRTLGEAIQAVAGCTAADKAVVKLLADIDLGNSNQEINSGVFTIDLNGKTLSGNQTSLGVLHIEGKISGTKPDVTIADSGNNGTITGSGESSIGVYAKYSTVTITGGKISGEMFGLDLIQGTANIEGGEISGEYAVDTTTFCTVTITGGEISGDVYSVYAKEYSNVTVTGGSFTGSLKIKGTFLLGLGQNGSGATFVGGLTIDDTILDDVTTVNAILGEGAAYWQGTKMIVPADDATSITGGDVTVKAPCTHPAEDQTYPADRITEDTHTMVCPCGYEVTGNHVHNSGKCVCGEKVTPVVTAPTANPDLRYSGIPKPLIIAGSTSGGTLQYKLGADGTYSTELPAAANTGEYIVYYKVVGDDNYKDVAEQSITVVFERTRPPVFSLPNVLNEITYGQKLEEAKLSVYANSLGTFNWLEPDRVADSVGTISYAMGFYPTNMNYKWEDHPKWVAEKNLILLENEVTVKKAQGVGSVIMQGWVYGELPQTPQLISETNGIDNVTILYKVKGADDSTYTNEVPETSGAYTVKAIFATTEHYTEAVATADFTIAKAALTYTAPEAISLRYNGAAQALVTAGTVDGGTIYYKLNDGEWTTGIPTATDAGVYKVSFKIAGDASHTDIAETVVDDVAIVPASITVHPKAGQTMVYGEEFDIAYTYTKGCDADEPAFTGKFEVYDKLTGTFVIEKGTFALIDNGSFKASNYTLDFGRESLYVAKRPLTLTAEDQTILYGASIDDTAWIADSLAPGDIATVNLMPSTDKVTVEGVIGAALAIQNADGEDVIENYDITYVSGKLVIVPDTSKIDGLTRENVTSENAEDIQDVQELLENAESLNDELRELSETCEALLETIEDALDAVNTEQINNTLDITEENVKPSDKADLEAAKEDLEQALEEYSGNYTEEQKDAIEEQLQQVEDALTAIENIEAVEAAIKALPEEVEPDELDKAEQILAAKAAYDELSDHEKSFISDDAKEKLDALVAALTDYAIIRGDGSVWTAGSGDEITIVANGAFSKFIGVEVDGRLIPASSYDAKSGSTIVTLKASYLKTLSKGEHTMTILFSDGEASATFKIAGASATPPTGDSAMLGLWIVLVLISSCAVCVLLVNRKKRFHQVK